MSIRQKVLNKVKLPTDRLTSALAEVPGLLRELMGVQYATYTALPADDADDPSDMESFVTYDDLTDDDTRTRRDLEYAAANLTIWLMVPDLKELHEGDVLLETEGWGDGDIKPSDISQLMQMRSMYRERAEATINRWLDSLSDAEDEPVGAGNRDVRIFAI